MSAIEPAGEKIVRNLQQAVERLQGDIQRVELWAGALGGFTKPIPDYGHGQTRFDLPVNAHSHDRVDPEFSEHRETASALGSPQQEQLRQQAKND